MAVLKDFTFENFEIIYQPETNDIFESIVIYLTDNETISVMAVFDANYQSNHQLMYFNERFDDNIMAYDTTVDTLPNELRKHPKYKEYMKNKLKQFVNG